MFAGKSIALLAGFFLFILGAQRNHAETNSPSVLSVPATGHALELHNGFATRAKAGDIGIVFFGDSSTVCWQTTGKEIWDKEIAPLRPAEFGIYGDSAGQLLWRHLMPLRKSLLKL